MREALNNAQKELGRADHLFHVTLKYTRTVDVLKSLIQRLITAMDFGIEALLRQCKEKKLITDVPELPRLRIEILKKEFSDDPEIQRFLEFFMLLRKIEKAKFNKAMEYRRHVTMTVNLDEKQQAEITIDIIGDYFKKTKEFINYVEEIIKEKE
ncbi:MAG: hypothetical protein QW666_04165 [Candidatus Woesearchaeota archaeon]